MALAMDGARKGYLVPKTKMGHSEIFCFTILDNNDFLRILTNFVKGT